MVEDWDPNHKLLDNGVEKVELAATDRPVSCIEDDNEPQFCQ